MKVLHIVWALVSIGLSVGINDWTKPKVEYPLTIGQMTMSTGTVTLKVGSSQHQYALIDLHTVAADVHQVFGRVLTAREVWIRSPQEDEATPPDLELFFDFGDGQGFIAKDKRDIKLLLERPIPVRLRPLGREGSSSIRFPGTGEPSEVGEGTLTLEDAIEFETADAAASWRVRGELDLVVRDGDAQKTVRGHLRARMVWN